MSTRKVKFLTDLKLSIEQLKFLEKDNNSTNRTFKDVVNRFNKLAGDELEIVNKSVEKSMKEKYGEDIFSKKLNPKALPEKIHNPLDTIRLLSAFSNDDILRFTTHPWDYSSRHGFDYDKDFKKWIIPRFQELKKIHENAHDLTRIMVSQFIQTQNINSGWGRYNVTIGWSSSEITEWCKENPNKYPSQALLPKEKSLFTIYGGDEQKQFNYFEDIIKHFKKEIEFKAENAYFLSWLRTKIRLWQLKKEGNVILDKESLKQLNFFIDVGRFSSALDNIIDPIKERLKEPTKKEVRFSAKEVEGENCIYFQITHVNSYPEISERTFKKTIFTPITSNIKSSGAKGGNFKTVYTNLFGQCDWIFEAKFKGGEGNIKAFHFLDAQKGEANIQNSDFEEGTRHTLKLYI